MYSYIGSRQLHTTLGRRVAEIIDGKMIAREALEGLKCEIEKHTSSGGRAPRLTALLVGSNPASESYVKIKMKAAKRVGIKAETIVLPQTIDETSLLKEIESLNKNPLVDGILVQLPLPEGLKERRVCNAVYPGKDVDGYNEWNIGRLCLNLETTVPCTALAVLHIIRRIGIETLGKTALICGRSKNVGLPISLLLHSQPAGKTGGLDATTIICHRHTPREELKKLSLLADIIVSAAGVGELIRGDMVKEGACVIDVGMTRTLDKATNRPRFVGDVHFQEVSQVAGYISPVPGGVGPVTVAMLMQNTFRAATRTN